jgi:urease accessory protein
LTEGIAEIGFSQRDGITRLDHLYQRDPLRVLFPMSAAGDPILGVITTTSGGLVAGDRLDIAVQLATGAAAHVTTSAAEKIYRSIGPTATIRQSLSVAAGAALEFLPLETILFDGARLWRETTIDLGQNAGFLGGDVLVFGRRARGERFTRGLLHEVWQVSRAGALAWGDALYLDGDIGAVTDDPACFAGAAACATLILVPPKSDPRGLVDAARACQRQHACTGLSAGATAVGGMLVARWLGPDALSLRRAYAALAGYLRSAVRGLPPRLPRLWDI